jgi:DNA replication and repair protein RecF
VHIQHLACFHFRNLDKLDLHLSSRTVVVRGPNGQGKTNLLEALYVSATGRSFRAAGPRELIQFGTDQGWIRALFERHGVRHQIEAQLSPRRRAMRVDDKSLRHMSSLLQLVNVVAFFPDDLRIAKGSPEERRRFLDRAVANYRPEFVDASLAYSRALRSRNALLRTSTPPDRSVLAAYDEQLVQHGTMIQEARLEGLAAMAPAATERFSAIMPSAEPIGLALASGLDDPTGDFGESFRAALERSYPRDRARGMTHAGPHRADLLLTLGDRPARVYGSQGQQRALVLALKLAEVASLKARLGTTPILLLDDVSSELDRERTESLFSTLAEAGCQLWVSTTGAAPLPLPTDAQILELTEGRVVQATH